MFLSFKNLITHFLWCLHRIKLGDWSIMTFPQSLFLIQWVLWMSLYHFSGYRKLTLVQHRLNNPRAQEVTKRTPTLAKQIIPHRHQQRGNSGISMLGGAWRPWKFRCFPACWWKKKVTRTFFLNLPDPPPSVLDKLGQHNLPNKNDFHRRSSYAYPPEKRGAKPPTTREMERKLGYDP